MNTLTQVTDFLTNYHYDLAFVGILPIGKIVLAVGVFILLNTLFWTLRKVVLVKLRLLSRKTSNHFDDMLVAAIQGVRVWVYSIVSLYAAIHVFAWPETVEKVFLGVFLFAIIWQGIEILVCVVHYVTKKFSTDEDGLPIDANSATMSHLIQLVIRVSLWGIGTIFLLANLGVNITSLVAGLGIGGIAVAFALQGVLSDLFASLSLYFDKPFRIGDFVVIGTDKGTVQKIGIKSTRIRTLQGEELVVPNSELTSVRVQNFKKMEERRIISTFGITYETKRELVEAIPNLVRDIIKGVEKVRFDRIHFTAFGDSALLFELVYFVESPEMVVYLEAQQEFNFLLMKSFEEKGIGFAYPTQTIYNKTVS